MQLMALGDYRFGLETAAYEEFSRSTRYRWAAQDRLGRRPAQQYLGPGEETIDLAGTLYPFFRGGLGQIDEIRAEAERGSALLLTDGFGNVWGRWAIMHVEESQRIFDVNGAPRKIEFRLKLTRYGDDGENA